LPLGADGATWPPPHLQGFLAALSAAQLRADRPHAARRERERARSRRILPLC